MAKSRMINTKFWEDSYIQELSTGEKLLYIYFLTNGSTNISGLYEISVKKVSFDTSIKDNLIVKALKKFSDADKIYFYNNWIYIKNFVRHQQKNPKVIKGMMAALKDAPEDILSHFGITIDENNFTATNNKRKKLSPNLRLKILERDNFKCVFCGIDSDSTHLQIDHIKPIRDGGENKESNLRVLCQDCNTGRNKDVDYEKTNEIVYDRLSHLNLNLNSNLNPNLNPNLKVKGSSFKKPSLEEIKSYCDSRKNFVDPERFLDHYESNGWLIGGKSKMKCWKAAVRNWERNNFNQKKGNTNGKQSTLTNQLETLAKFASQSDEREDVFDFDGDVINMLPESLG